MPAPESVAAEEEIAQQIEVVQTPAQEAPIQEVFLPKEPFAEELQERPSLYSRLPEPDVRRRHAALGIAAVMALELVVNVLTFATTFSIYDYYYPKK